jgi:hypothetical protein
MLPRSLSESNIERRIQRLEVREGKSLLRNGYKKKRSIGVLEIKKERNEEEKKKKITKNVERDSSYPNLTRTNEMRK